jgi:hypothetical protein
VCLVCLALCFDARKAVDATAAKPVAGAFEGESVGVVDDAVDHGCGDVRANTREVRTIKALPRDAWPWWFVSDLRGMHPRALVESPSSFRRRGVFITSGALERG